MASTMSPTRSSSRFVAMSAWLMMPTNCLPSITGRRRTL